MDGYTHTMTRLLIVDDEANIRTMIRKYAVYEGFEADEAPDGMQAVEMCRSRHYDLVIMDVMMPELDGFSAVKDIRRSSPQIPVIMLTALGEEYDRIHGFDVGADDYVVKPFSGKELMMRVKAILKRTGGGEAADDRFIMGGLEVDYSARVVTVDGERVAFSPKEYELLVYLIRNRGIAVTREAVLEHVWGYNYFGDDRTLDTHMKLLRKNLGPYGKCIVTLRGVGYRFEKDA